MIMINLVTGLIFALLINYSADVLPYHRKFVAPLCCRCHKPVGWLKYLLNLPCPECGQRRSLRWFLLLLLMPVLFIFMDLSNLYRFDAIILDKLLISLFALVVVIDIEHRAILNEVAIACALVCGLLGLELHGLQSTLIGGVVGYCAMLVLYLFGVLFLRLLNRYRTSPITEDALGFGDVNIGGVLGLILGWPGISAGLLLGIILGGLISGLFLVIQLARTKYSAYYALPYAPFLVAGALVIIYWPS